MRNLKEDGTDSEILVFGSGELVRTLANLDLIDEYRLLTFPIILGSGKRMFRNGTKPATLRLVSSTVTSTGVLISSYVSAQGIG